MTITTLIQTEAPAPTIYTYYGPADGVRHTALVRIALSEAVTVTGEHGWEVESTNYCHDEVFNEDTRKWEPEAKVVLRRRKG